jgi:hypothetical protein
VRAVVALVPLLLVGAGCSSGADLTGTTDTEPPIATPFATLAPPTTIAPTTTIDPTAPTIDPNAPTIPPITGTLPPPGECIPGTYEIEEGDFPLRVAEKFDVTVAALDAANANTDGYGAFFPGLDIVIPC